MSSATPAPREAVVLRSAVSFTAWSALATATEQRRPTGTPGRFQHRRSPRHLGRQLEVLERRLSPLAGTSRPFIEDKLPVQPYLTNASSTMPSLRPGRHDASADDGGRHPWRARRRRILPAGERRARAPPVLPGNKERPILRDHDVEERTPRTRAQIRSSGSSPAGSPIRPFSRRRSTTFVSGGHEEGIRVTAVRIEAPCLIAGASGSVKRPVTHLLIERMAAGGINLYRGSRGDYDDLEHVITSRRRSRTPRRKTC